MSIVKDRLYGLLIKAAGCAGICRRTSNRADEKPKIYISGETLPRKKTALAVTLKCTVILPSEEYFDSSVMRALSPQNVITDNGGFSTEWLHTALKRLKTDSVLLFPDGGSGYGGAVVLSLMSGADIVPLYSKANYKFIRRSSIAAGAPIVPRGKNDLSAEWINSEIERVGTAMSAVREECHADHT